MVCARVHKNPYGYMRRHIALQKFCNGAVLMVIVNGIKMTDKYFRSGAGNPTPTAHNDPLAPLAARRIGAMEETSLVALLDYLADTKFSTPRQETQSFYERFGIAALNELPATQFDDAVQYLVDQMPVDSLPDLQVR